MKKMYYLLSLAIAIPMLFGCGSSKSTGIDGEQEINMPCSGPEYQTNNEYFRATMFSLSTDMGTAKSKALTSARAELATSMNAIVERTNDSYTSSYQSGEQEEAKIKMNDMAKIVVREKITDSRITCEKMMKTKDGKYRCYITVETSKESVLNSMKNQLMNDEKLRIDFEYEKYRKTFEEEMNKLKN